MKPKLRYVDVIPIRGGFWVKDLVGLSDGIIVSKKALLLMSLMDGSRNTHQIKLEYLRLTGELLRDEELEEFIKALDRALLLENERYYKALAKRREEIIKEGIRRMSHAGEAYPAEAESCKEFLRGKPIEEKLSPLGIMTPHMDLRVAKDTYWQAYGRLKEDKELVVILGVSHYLHEMPFSVLPVDLETPFGILKTDKKLVEKLQSFYHFDITHDLLSYAQEYSIEFPSLYVKMLFPEARVLALIVSYGDEDFLKNLGENLLRAIGKDVEKTLFISSVDLSHVGKKFGDAFSYDPSFMDKEYLRLLEELNYQEAFELLKRDNNRTRIDGQYTNFLFGHLLKECGITKGRLLDYQIYHEDFTDSKVSYASMVF